MSRTDANNRDTDGDGLSDGEEVLQWHTDPSSVDTDQDGLSDSDELTLWHTDPTRADTDGDGITNSVEGAAPNGGDANDDNFPDYLQSNVTSLVSPVSSKYVVVQTTCTQNSSTSNSAESTTNKDPNYDYPSGLTGFTTTCPSEGYTAQITYFAYGSYDPTNTSLRKYNPTTGAYTTLMSANLSSTTIGGQSVLKGVYSITDGGEFDLDGTANGVIVDPVGAAIAATIAPNTGYGWRE